MSTNRAKKAPQAAPNSGLTLWPADQVERRPLASLVPYARNARMHDAAQVTRLAESITQWGWTIPVLVDERDEVIAGHGRIMAAQQLGIDSVPVMVARGWSAAQVKAYRLADNKLNELSTWDAALLTVELAELNDLGLASLSGFSAVELDSLLTGASDTDANWQGMPEVAQGNEEAFRSLTVHFVDEAGVKAFAALIGQPFTDRQKYLWFPPVQRRDEGAHRYVSTEQGAEQ
ncbi:ParB-like nuclease family protein [Paraburkholderia sp. BL8N3]|nr:ParB/Srx family N-terminal domain-containing protein [Paraburkholderia sp. BL8N3]TCK37984.1 ParB-like nuclease family protein [Paraburkholderia sp. BL8N3]